MLGLIIGSTGAAKFVLTWRPSNDYIHLKVNLQVTDSTLLVRYALRHLKNGFEFVKSYICIIAGNGAKLYTVGY